MVLPCDVLEKQFLTISRFSRSVLYYIGKQLNTESTSISVVNRFHVPKKSGKASSVSSHFDSYKGFVPGALNTFKWGGGAVKASKTSARESGASSQPTITLHKYKYSSVTKACAYYLVSQAKYSHSCNMLYEGDLDLKGFIIHLHQIMI